MTLRLERRGEGGASCDCVDDVESTEVADGDCEAVWHCKQWHGTDDARTDSEEEIGGGREMVEMEELVE